MADTSSTLRYNYLHLKRFLQKATLTAKVNNWGFELSDYIIKFKFRKGVENTLADIPS